MSYKIYKIYFEFYPINCRIEVENCNNRTKLNQYKDISYYIEKEKNESSFKIRRLNYNNGQSCLFCSSSYFSYNSKILIKNIPQYSFVKYNDEIEYLYFHSELENDLEITFGTNRPGNNNNASYYIIYLINDSFKTRVKIYYNDSFIIESKKVKKYCRDEKEVCMIKFILYSLYYKESVFKIQVTTIIKENNDKIVIFGFIGMISIFLIIVIIHISVCIYKRSQKKKKDLLALKVNQVSFQEEKINRRNESEDGLLY